VPDVFFNFYSSWKNAPIYGVIPSWKNTPIYGVIPSWKNAPIYGVIPSWKNAPIYGVIPSWKNARDRVEPRHCPPTFPTTEHPKMPASTLQSTQYFQLRIHPLVRRLEALPIF
jgi:hypothetical protein